jgi:hypothetical protein
MSKRQQPTKKNQMNPKKSSNSNNNSSNVKGQGPRKQGNARPQASRGAQKQVSVAANYASGQSGKAPVVRATRDSCNVVHRELLMNVSAQADLNFDLRATYPLNPGMSQTFPWLSTIAQNWETYRFKKLRFCYYTRTGSTTVGSVLFAPDYDAADSAPANEQIASTYEDVQEDAPWKDITIPLRPVEMHQPGQRKYVRTGPLATNLDIKTYDSGNLFVFTVDSLAAAPWGKLWVEYDVDLFTPQSLSSAPVGVAGGGFESNGGETGALLLGTAPIVGSGSQFVTLVNTGGASTFTFEKTGTYVISYNFGGTTMSAFNNGGTATSNPFNTLFDATGANCAGGIIVTVSAPGQTWIPSLTAATIVSPVAVNIGSMPFGSAL